MKEFDSNLNFIHIKDELKKKNKKKIINIPEIKNQNYDLKLGSNSFNVSQSQTIYSLSTEYPPVY